MPIWLRKFTFNKLQEHYKNEKEQIENSQNGGNKKNLIDPSGKINAPEFMQASEQYKRPAKYK
jgi:hypothetical protein